MARKLPSPEPIHLPGTTLEGGGQLLRLALSLSSLTHTPIHVSRIRGNRSGGGGLKAQHLTCAQWLASACNARLSGAGLKSKELTFTPTPSSISSTAVSRARAVIEERGNQITITQSTPGSVNLVLQAVLPFVLFSGAEGGVRVTISGGANVGNSPSCEYIREVLGPVLECIGVPRIDMQVHSQGWATGSLRVGSVTYTITPLKTALPAFQLRHRGEITGLKAIVVAPRYTEGEWRDELDVMVEKCSDRLFGNNKGATFDVEFSDSHHEKRYYLLLVATCSTGLRLGRDWLYDIAIRQGKTSQIVPSMVRKVAKDLLGEVEHGGCVDEFMRDQLVVFQALGKGRSEVFGGESNGKNIEASLHAKTAMWVSKEVVGVEFDDMGGCEGMGFEPRGVENGQEVSVEEVVKDMSKLDVKE